MPGDGERSELPQKSARLDVKSKINSKFNKNDSRGPRFMRKCFWIAQIAVLIKPRATEAIVFFVLLGAFVSNLGAEASATTYGRAHARSGAGMRSDLWNQFPELPAAIAALPNNVCAKLLIFMPASPAPRPPVPGWLLGRFLSERQTQIARCYVKN